VQSTARNLGLVNKNRPRNTEDMSAFKSVNNPKIAYLLGLLWADGHISTKGNVITLLLKASDGKSLKQLIHSTASSWYSWSFNGYGEYAHKKYTQYNMSSHALKQHLIEHDFHIKSRSAPIKILNLIPEHLKHYWWRGYFDGDGCFYLGKKDNKGAISITSHINQDWTFAAELFHSLGICYVRRTSITSKGCSSRVCLESETPIRRFCDYIYSGESFGLLRKLNKYQQYLAHKSKIVLRKTSPYKGVFWDKQAKRWKMQIGHNKLLHVSFFDDPTQAAREYNQLAVKLHGSKAKLNTL
jgi:hypothetical protein